MTPDQMLQRYEAMKRDALRELLAEAWEQGCRAGQRYAHYQDGQPVEALSIGNPYRDPLGSVEDLSKVVAAVMPKAQPPLSIPPTPIVPLKEK